TQARRTQTRILPTVLLWDNLNILNVLDNLWLIAGDNAIFKSRDDTIYSVMPLLFHPFVFPRSVNKTLDYGREIKIGRSELDIPRNHARRRELYLLQGRELCEQLQRLPIKHITKLSVGLILNLADESSETVCG